MNRRDLNGKKLHVVVTDGERTLQQRVCSTMKNVVLVLDLIHVLEKLWDVAHAPSGEGSDKAEKFVIERILKILYGKVSQVVQGLRQIVTKRDLEEKQEKVLLDTAKYYYRNKKNMQYNIYLSKGSPIAGGSVEGACNNLIKD